MSRVLIVEDYTSIQIIFRTALEHEGYEVTVASDGQEALKLANDQTPDLILLDLLMPNVGGLEFLQTYDLTKHPETKVIVFSNLASPELGQEAKKLGAVRYLTKSKLTPKELADVVKETLAQK